MQGSLKMNCSILTESLVCFIGIPPAVPQSHFRDLPIQKICLKDLARKHVGIYGRD